MFTRYADPLEFPSTIPSSVVVPQSITHKVPSIVERKELHKAMITTTINTT